MRTPKKRSPVPKPTKVHQDRRRKREKLFNLAMDDDYLSKEGRTDDTKSR